MIIALVVATAAAGGLGRWLITLAMAKRATWPVGLLLANLGGAFVAGWLNGSASADVRVVVGTGLIGSFTSVSSIAAAVAVWPEQAAAAGQRPSARWIYVAVTVTAGLALAWLGLRTAR